MIAFVGAKVLKKCVVTEIWYQKNRTAIRGYSYCFLIIFCIFAVFFCVIMPLCLQLFVAFAKIGAFTIGGGYAMIPLIERDVVERHGWVNSKEFLDLLVLAQAMPGVLAVNIAIAVGNRLYGRKGAFASALGAVMPSFITILCLAAVLTHYHELPVVAKIFRAVRPAVVALIAVPVINLAKTAGLTWRNAWIPLVAALLIWLCGVSPVLIIAVGIAGGIIYVFFCRHRTDGTKSHPS